MSGNRSLDEFVGSGSGGSSGEEEASGDEGAGASGVDGAELEPDATDPAHDSGDAADSGDAPGDRGAVTNDHDDVTGDDEDAEADRGASDDVDREASAPPASTYVWSPSGGTCDGCGETVAERWRDGEDLVCAGCKEW